MLNQPYTSWYDIKQWFVVDEQLNNILLVFVTSNWSTCYSIEWMGRIEKCVEWKWSDANEQKYKQFIIIICWIFLSHKESACKSIIIELSLLLRDAISFSKSMHYWTITIHMFLLKAQYYLIEFLHNYSFNFSTKGEKLRFWCCTSHIYSNRKFITLHDIVQFEGWHIVCT